MVPGLCKFDFVLVEQKMIHITHLKFKNYPNWHASKSTSLKFLGPIFVYLREIDNYTDMIITCQMWTSKMIQVTQMYQTSSKSVF